MSQCRTHMEKVIIARGMGLSQGQRPPLADESRLRTWYRDRRRSIARSPASRVTAADCNGSSATAAAMTILIGSILHASDGAREASVSTYYT